MLKDKHLTLKLSKVDEENDASLIMSLTRQVHKFCIHLGFLDYESKLSGSPLAKKNVNVCMMKD